MRQAGVLVSQGAVFLLYDDDKDYTQSYLTNPHWYIPRENVEGFKLAMDEWPKVKAAVLKHIESVKNVTNFEV